MEPEHRITEPFFWQIGLDNEMEYLNPAHIARVFWTQGGDLSVHMINGNEYDYPPESTAAHDLLILLGRVSDDATNE